MDKIYRKRYRVFTFDVDASGKAHLPVVLNFFQDAARDHAGFFGFSVFDLQKKGLTWVMSRYHIKAPRYPVMGDSVEVSTWTSGRHGFFAMREFEARDAGGKLLVAATSSWMVITLDKKQPVRPESVVSDENVLDKRAIPDRFEPLSKPERADKEMIFRAQLRDLDFNNHVNNVGYIHWALEGMPADVLRSSRASEVEIVYKAEVFYGDEILSRVQAAGPGQTGVFLHQLVNRESGVELARLRTSWK
jgi:medium-chain acyl-[acyl-carrier-protein] hydrolase